MDLALAGVGIVLIQPCSRDKAGGVAQGIQVDTGGACVEVPLGDSAVVDEGRARLFSRLDSVLNCGGVVCGAHDECVAHCHVVLDLLDLCCSVVVKGRADIGEAHGGQFLPEAFCHDRADSVGVVVLPCHHYFSAGFQLFLNVLVRLGAVQCFSGYATVFLVAVDVISRDILFGLCLCLLFTAGCQGCQGEDHDECQKNCQYLFHFVFLLENLPP